MKIIKNFSGLVVLDEAYIDFAPEKGLLDDLVVLPNLVILRTLSLRQEYYIRKIIKMQTFFEKNKK